MEGEQIYLCSRDDRVIITIRKIILAVALTFLMIIPMASASLGSYQQNRCVTIKTILVNATAVNISTISLPDSTIAEGNKTMTLQGNTWIYRFCNTSQIGTYIYDYSDQSGNTYVNDFTITASGTSGGVLGNFGLFILLFAFGYAILFVGIFTRNIPTTILGGFALIIMGLYTLINGIDMYRNFATEAFSIITFAFGGFWAAKASLESLEIYNDLV